MLVGIWLPSYADNGSEPPKPVELHFKRSNGGTINRPQKPAYSPIYGVANENEITIYSNIEGEGNIIVLDFYGRTIVNEYADFGNGYTFSLNESDNNVTIYVTINEVEYYSVY